MGIRKQHNMFALLPQGDPNLYANPQGVNTWAKTEGQSFALDHSSPDIDFAAIHLWCASMHTCVRLSEMRHRQPADP